MISNNPNTVIVIPAILLIFMINLSLNFLRKMLINEVRVYHHKPPPVSTPTSTSDCIKLDGFSPNTEIPANTPIKTIIATGFETVRKNNDKKSSINPFRLIFF